MEKPESDFIKHLRTVHFALVVVSVGLIIAYTADSKNTAEEGHKQINEIIEELSKYKVESESDGKKEVYYDLGKGFQQLLVGKGYLEESLPSPFSAVTLKIGLGKLKEDKHAVYGKFLDNNSQIEDVDAILTIKAPKLGEALNKKITIKQPPWKDGDQPKNYLIYSLNDFKNFWNEIGDAKSFYKPSITNNQYSALKFKGNQAEVILLSDINWDEKEIENQEPVSQLESIPAQAMGEKVSLTGRKYQHEFDIRILSDNQNIINYFSGMEYKKSTAQEVFSQVPKFTSEFENDLFFETSIPLLATSVAIDGSKLLREWFSEEWKFGKFNYTFRELDNITKDYQYLPLQTLEEILFLQAKREKPTFEALGISMPSTVIATWGVVILASLCIYFYMHISNFYRKFPNYGSVNVSPDIPWIGVYPDVISKATFALTTVALPVSVVTFIFLNELEKDRYENIGNSIHSIGAMVMVVIVSTITFWKIFKRQ